MNAHEIKRAMAPLRQIEAYWQALRPALGVPNRSDIDPRGIESALEYAFIAERLTPQMAKFRVAGCHLNDVVGMHMAGMPLSSLIEMNDRKDFAAALEHLFETPGIVTIALESPAGFGQPALVAEMILLPLRSDLEDVSRILGGFVTCGQIGRTPRRFRITSIRKTGLDEPVRHAPLARTWGSRPALPPVTQPTRSKPLGLSDGNRPYIPKPKRERPGLRLVIDNS